MFIVLDIEWEIQTQQSDEILMVLLFNCYLRSLVQYSLALLGTK